MRRADSIAATQPRPPAPRSEEPSSPEPPASPSEHPVDEAIALYHGQWILMKVTEHDADNMPAKGYVLAHSPHRADISKALAKEPPRSASAADAPIQPYYVFKAYPRLR